MGCIISTLCCAGQCCNMLCCCCKGCGVRSKHQSNISYAVLQIIFLLIAITLMLSIGDIEINADDNPWIAFFIGDDQRMALSIRIVLRMSFSLAIFHSLVLIMSIPGYLDYIRQKHLKKSNHCAAHFYEGFWTLKILMILGIFMLSQFI